MFSQSEDLLQAIQLKGWTVKRQKHFLEIYGPLLRRALITELGRRFGHAALRGLAEYLQSLEQAQQPTTGGLGGQFLELACNTWQEAWLEIFKTEGNTIAQYAGYREKCARENRQPLSFAGFLWGLVRLKLRQQMRSHAQPTTPVNLHTDPEDENADPGEECRSSDDGNSVETLAICDEVDVYWEELLRCAVPAPEEVERRLNLQQRKEHLLCWTCCELKGALRGRRRENLIAFVAFFVSQRGPQQPREPLPTREQLSLSTLTGRYLRWDEDISRIFRKSLRKDRVLAEIRDALSRSGYSMEPC